MNKKGWAMGAMLALFVSGCGNIGNTAGYVGNQMGNAAGQVGSAVDRTGGAIGRGVGEFAGSAPGIANGLQFVQVDSAAKRVTIHLQGTMAHGHHVVAPGTAMNLTVPTGWTVSYSGLAHGGWNGALAMIPYTPGPARNHVAGSAHDVTGTLSSGYVGGAQSWAIGNGGMTPSGDYSFRASTPGRYALVYQARGHTNGVISLVTITRSTTILTFGAQGAY